MRSKRAFLACWCHPQLVRTRILWEWVPGWVLSCWASLEMLARAWDENVSLTMGPHLLCSTPTPACEAAAAVAKQPVYLCCPGQQIQKQLLLESSIWETPRRGNVNSANAHHLWPSPLCWEPLLPRGVSLPLETGKKKWSRSLMC